MSDEEHKGNLNHLGPKMLTNMCEFLIHSSSSKRDDDAAHNIVDEQFDESDGIRLATLFTLKCYFKRIKWSPHLNNGLRKKQTYRK